MNYLRLESSTFLTHTHFDSKPTRKNVLLPVDFSAVATLSLVRVAMEVRLQFGTRFLFAQNNLRVGDEPHVVFFEWVDIDFQQHHLDNRGRNLEVQID